MLPHSTRRGKPPSPKAANSPPKAGATRRVPWRGSRLPGQPEASGATSSSPARAPCSTSANFPTPPAGSARGERRHVVIAGSRRLLEICELPDRAGGTIGFAIDRTDVEGAETALARHINAHGQVLESIHAAVAIYGPDKRLNFFNSAFARLWGVEEEWLAGSPSPGAGLGGVRGRRPPPQFSAFPT